MLITHVAFDVMVLLGVLLMGLSLWFWIAHWRKSDTLFGGRRLLWALLLSGPLGFIALEAGWIVTEVGRQPWVINGILRTADAVTPAPGVPQVFYGFVALYLVLAAAVVAFLRHVAGPGGEPLTAPQELPVHPQAHDEGQGS